MSTDRYGTIVIVCPPVPDVSGVHEARLYNLREFVDANGWKPVVVTDLDPVIHDHIDRLVLIAREGYTADELAETVRTTSTNSGLEPYKLSWIDIDACRRDTGLVFGELAELVEQWPPQAWHDLVAPPAGPVDLASAFRKAGQRGLHAESLAANPTSAETAPLVAFVGDASPRASSEARFVAPDGSFIAGLTSGALEFFSSKGVRTHRFEKWLDGIGSNPTTRLLAVGHESGVYRVVVSTPQATFSVLSTDRATWLPHEQIGASAVAAAIIGEDVLLVDGRGHVTSNGSPFVGAGLGLSVHGIDILSRKGVGTWLAAWGTTREGDRSAEVLRRDGASWVTVARCDDVVRAGLERTTSGQIGRGNRGLWVERVDGSTHRSEVGST